MNISPANFTNYAIFIVSLVIIGSLAALGFYELLGSVGIDIPSWLEVPGGIGIAGLLFSLFDKYFWAWPIFRWLGLIDFPDLRGRWEGEIVSSYENEKTTLPAVIEIKQTSSSIQVYLYAEESKSKSLSTSLEKDDDGVDLLRYGYINQPDSLSIDSMHIHYGSAQLRYYSDMEQLTGEYFTSKERVTHGKLIFNYSSKELLGRFTK